MKKYYFQPIMQADVVRMTGPLLVIAPSGEPDEHVRPGTEDEDPNAAPLREEQDPWSDGLW